MKLSSVADWFADRPWVLPCLALIAVAVIVVVAMSTASGPLGCLYGAGFPPGWTLHCESTTINNITSRSCVWVRTN